MAKVVDIIIYLLAFALLVSIGYALANWIYEYQVWLQTPLFVGEKYVYTTQEMWSFSHIARKYYPEMDIRDAIDMIRAINPNLDPGKMRIGTKVMLP